MRQIRTSGSEGGETAIKAVFPTPIEDCNDHDTLRHDPVLKMVADRLPEEEA